MKFLIEKETFLKGIYLIQGIIDKKKTLPILSNTLIEANNNYLSITATDLEITIKNKYKIDIINEGKITVSAKKLFEIIKELPNKLIEFESLDNNWINIKCDNAEFNIVALTCDEFPIINNFMFNSCNIEKNELIDIIDKTSSSICINEGKYNLNGIYIHNNIYNEIKYLTCVTTDGHRLSILQKEIDLTKFIRLDKGIILPKKGIVELKKLIECSDNDLEFAIEENNAIFKNNNNTIIMRLIDGEFPDYRRVIPNNKNNFAIINTTDFLHSLKRISIFSNEKSKGINLVFTKNNLEISSSNPIYGDAKENIIINYKGNEIKVGFNAKYIIDVLNNIITNNIIFYINDSVSPCLIEPEDNKSYQSIIMPMKV